MAKILVVDDDPTFRQRLADAARDVGAEVVDVGSLEEAIRLIKEDGFDVVVTDLGLKGGPGEEGLEVIKAAKDKDVATQVVAVSTYTVPGINARAMDLGAYTYLQRSMPASAFQAELAQNIHGALEVRRQLITGK